MSIKLIASDLDGTLLTDKKELSPGTRKALDMAAAQGIYIVPATGRSFESVPEMIREYPGVKYLITANGGAVYSAEAGKRIYQCLLSPESVDAAIAVRQREKIVMEAVIDGIPYAEEEYVTDPLSCDGIRCEIYQGDEKTGEGYSAVCSRAQSGTGQYFFCMQS